MLQTYFNSISHKTVSCGINIVQKMILLCNCQMSYISILYSDRSTDIYFDDIFLRIKIYFLSIHIILRAKIFKQGGWHLIILNRRKQILMISRKRKTSYKLWSLKNALTRKFETASDYWYIILCKNNKIRVRVLGENVQFIAHCFICTSMNV